MRELLRAGFAFSLVPLAALAVGCQDSPISPGDEDPQIPPPGDHAVMGPESGVSLGAHGESFGPGEQVLLILNNASDADIGYNLCVHDLERRVNGEWEPLHIDRICTLELRLLAPGGSATAPADLPDPLAPGEYRLRTVVHLMDEGEMRDLVSEPFAVAD